MQPLETMILEKYITRKHAYDKCKSECRIVPRVWSRSWKRKKEEGAGGGAAVVVSGPGRHHSISPQPQPRDVSAVAVSIFQMRKLRPGGEISGPWSGCRHSAEPGRDVCADCTSHVLGHQALLPDGSCPGELDLCGPSVLILCLFMSFPNFFVISI